MSTLPPVRYAAVFLDAPARAALLAAAPPAHPYVTADHVTLLYQPPPEAAVRLPLGSRLAFAAVGVVDDGAAHAVAVGGLPPALASLPRAPHVTLAVAEGTPNAAAGAAVAAGGWAPLAVALTGRVGLELADGRGRVFSLAEWVRAGQMADAADDELHPLAAAWLAAGVDGADAAHPLPPRPGNKRAAREARPPRAPAAASTSSSTSVAVALDWCASVDARAAQLLAAWHGAAEPAAAPAAPAAPASPPPAGDQRPTVASAWLLAGVSPPARRAEDAPASPAHLAAAARAVAASSSLWRARAATLRAEAAAHAAVRAQLTAAADAAAALGDGDASRLLRSRSAAAATRAADARSSAAAAAAEGHNGTHVNRWWVDLHGLPVADGVDVLVRHVRVLRALAAGPVVLTVVVGWGRNSPAGVARLLPAVTAWLRRRGVPYGEDETNPGLVHVFLGRR